MFFIPLPTSLVTLPKMSPLYFGYNSAELALFVFVNAVGNVSASRRFVGWYYYYLEFVDFEKLFG